MSRLKKLKSGLVVPESVPDSPPPASFSTGPSDHNNLDKLACYARNGFVIVERATEDGTAETFRQWTIKEARQRFNETADMVTAAPKEHRDDPLIKEIHDRTKKFLERLDFAIKRAQEQGCHTDPVMRRARVRALPKTVRMPSKVKE